MAAKTPLARMKDQFGDKAKLVAALEKLAGADLWVARTNESKGLAHVSNAKLLRLHATFTEVKEKFGTRDKLVAAVLDLEKRSKDTGMQHKLSTWPVPRLLDAYKSAAKRQGRATAASKTAETKAPAAKKAASAKSAKASKTTGATGEAGAKAPAKKKAT
jgi:hypothetical protein